MVMAFGKRNGGVASPTSTPNLARRASDRVAAAVPAAPVAPVAAVLPMARADFLERIGQLKEHVEEMFLQAVVVAESIKEGGRINDRGFASAIERKAHPICIAGFSRHFNFMLDGKLQHGVVAFAREGKVVDPQAQLLLFELATTVIRFNAMCWEAYDDGALTMALQSQTSRGDIDRIIALSGTMTGLIDNLVAGEASLEATGRPVPAEAARQKLYGWLNRAREAMVEPARFEALAPKLAWPVSVVEMGVADHAGQLVVNHVYLPEQLAKPIMETMAREQAKATTQTATLRRR
jgi:hypothetical protein